MNEQTPIKTIFPSHSQDLSRGLLDVVYLLNKYSPEPAVFSIIHHFPTMSNSFPQKSLSCLTNVSNISV